ncbi:serine/threonine protein phosphatase 1 [Hymenobacter daecheongensis DSM 21074]|uniref:Serine/threonine protein phosphatase 1 n=1 Tax=Hymenobacter daecheongensis DSM 21074 TaxID=1121955 RepID=A0A1M6GBE1_9BACT|nr:metallophosphoesterase [Hymenobacter daecheongensis]SHJ07199.1 serine/threonine protein phosphatase 1 [Hymenobacter daecheongensis DSM 21074]
METYVLGDIHGAFRALEQVLARSPFRPGLDRLIQLGDVADGWPDTPECVERLLSIPNSIWVQGNHDWWTAEWLTSRLPPAKLSPTWLSQGGQATYEAYQRGPQEQLSRHQSAFFGRQLLYFEDEANNLYLHAGYDPTQPISQQKPAELLWTRELWLNGWEALGYTECYIGHTPTWPESAVPRQQANVWNIDQGAGYGGRLTMLNVRTKEFVQSDPVPELYPGVKGR